MRQPLQASRVEQQMRKTGNTQFAFERDGSVHGRRLVPADAGAQRILRRDGLAGLVRSRAIGLSQKGGEDARSERKKQHRQGKDALWRSQAREAIENLAARSLGPLP